MLCWISLLRKTWVPLAALAGQVQLRQISGSTRSEELIGLFLTQRMMETTAVDDFRNLVYQALID
jgi:hypothetical protein